MASKEATVPVERGGAEKGKRMDCKQRKLITEGRGTDGGKKVIFKLEEEKEEGMERRGGRGEAEDRIWEEVKLMRDEEKKTLIENIEKMREERKAFIENMKVKERFWEERIRGIEEKIIERENKVKEWIENAEKRLGERREEYNKEIKDMLDEIERKIGLGLGYTLEERGRGGEEHVRRKEYNRTGSACSGRWSEGSLDRLSGREVGVVRKLVVEREKEERKCNIVIRE